MSLVSSCDTLEYWTAYGGTHALDTVDKQEGLASIVLTGNGIENWICEEYNPPGVWDWTDQTSLAIRLNPESSNRETRVYLVDINGVLAQWFLGEIPIGWAEYTLDLDAPNNTTGIFDKSQVDRIQIYYSTLVNPYYIKIDDIRVAPAALTHTLTVNSTPMGIPFTRISEGIETSEVTNWSGLVKEAVWEVSMPSNVLVNGDTWNFKAQIDPITKEPISTNPITTVNLIADTALEYAYELSVLTAIQIHAFYEGEEINAEGLIIETSTEFTTPATIEVPTGTYTIRLTYLSQTQESLVQVAEGQTLRIDAQFVGPTPIPPVAIVAVMVAIPVGYILWKILKK